ncbi:MAG: hybrid sensor histidine kinase/response regulator [Desulfobulbaceae bacterium]|nr:hybrid sensor histidine kinase/response regulator [Desulfobulbaceae bacterium]
MIQGNADKRNKASIVIVDDEEPILKELRILLSRLYKVHIFTNPVKAEEFVDQNEVDLVISDEMMPEMRGSVLLTRIHTKHPAICNIVLSGQAEKDDIVRAVNEGHLFSFLYKPVERQQLMNVIEKGLENRNMKIQLARQNAKLKEYSENLERMVEEKTEQLVKAYDRLNMLDENKMSFLMYLSQEIDSPLDRIKKLAEVLLSYFAFAGAMTQFTKQSISLKPLVNEILQELHSRVDQSEVALDMNVPDDAIMAADQEYLKKVLKILLENAFIFTPGGGKVSLTSQTVDGKTQFCVTDTGKGIAHEDLKKIFKPFIIERSKRHKEGFGLNLPMARSIIIGHEGKIWAESEGPGKGSKFCIELAASN